MGVLYILYLPIFSNHYFHKSKMNVTTSTMCSSGVYPVPTAGLGQTLFYCELDAFGGDNATTVLKSCCNENKGALYTPADGCNFYCYINGQQQLDSTRSCMNASNTPIFCGSTSKTSLNTTTTSSAPLPTKSDSTRQFSPKNFLLGMVLLLAVSLF